MPSDKRQKDLFQETTMSFGEHLEELRVCLWRAVVGLVIGFVFGMLAGTYVVEFIQTPLENALINYYEDKAVADMKRDTESLREAGYPENITDIAVEQNLLPELVYLSRGELSKHLGITPSPPATEAPSSPATEGTSDDFDRVAVHVWHDLKNDPRIRPKALNAHEAFMIWVKASFVVGVILSSPWVFFQVWSFIAAGLYHHEKKYVYLFLPVSLGLFVGGAALAFFVVFGYVLDFLFTFNASMGIDPDPRISEWMSFVLMLPLGFGIAFQLPLVMYFLERIGIFTVKAYVSKWRVAVLVICIIAMFLTPADPQSMLLMALPLCVLYFGGILMCKLIPRRESVYDDLDEEPDAA